MRLFITLAIASFGVMGVLSQGGGGGEEEYGHHRERGTVIGLSRGIEVGRGHYGGGEEERGHEERGGGGGGGGGGGEVGFGGSHLITPVEVHHEEQIHLKAHPEYHYEYRIRDHKTKDYHQKHEVRDGYKVKGTYSLLEPDHKTVRVVDYTSDKKRGFVARVSYKPHY
ncbi:adult-specific cuticular protein ACP-22 precursor [Tribolium castaneum]|uniref:Cuticle protein n=1 Tax=Tribolium castaneum TaxID=7070 RepID=F6KV88_TRICA|nr:adult-specific cuticular protein ACP-22 precursor [Tribolium castaneum]AEG74043.1 cuticle protein [Tribolium castaneum]|eukprot:NP_001280523.1 adult-specific cuticular protein ACP-22 precursor [Tribolium castaneum]